MHALRLALKVPGFLWRQRRSMAALVLIAPLALTGDLELFAVNTASLGFAALTVLRIMQAARSK